MGIILAVIGGIFLAAMAGALYVIGGAIFLLFAGSYAVAAWLVGCFGLPSFTVVPMTFLVAAIIGLFMDVCYGPRRDN